MSTTDANTIGYDSHNDEPNSAVIVVVAINLISFVVFFIYGYIRAFIQHRKCNKATCFGHAPCWGLWCGLCWPFSLIGLINDALAFVCCYILCCSRQRFQAFRTSYTCCERKDVDLCGELYFLDKWAPYVCPKSWFKKDADDVEANQQQQQQQGEQITRF